MMGNDGTQNGTAPQTPAPATATTPPPGNAGTSAGTSADTSWIDRATKASGLETQQPADNNATIPQNKSPMQPAPTVITPLPRGGVRGFIDHALDSLAGSNKVEVYTDQHGNKYIQNPRATRGEQWMKIAGEAIEGAAAGWAAGKGAGNMGRAAEAGVQTGIKMNQEAQGKVNNAQLEVANSQILSHQLAAQNFEMSRLQVKADREDVDYAQKQLDDALRPSADGGPGGTNMGTVEDVGAVARLLKESPEVADAQVKRGDVRTIAAYDADGKRAGFHVVMMPPGWGTDTLPAGTPFDVAVPDPDHPGMFIRETQKSSEPMTRRQQSQYNDAASSKINAAQLIQHKSALEEQRATDQHQEQLNHNAAEQRAEQNQPATQAHVQAETNEANAAAARSRQETQNNANQQEADIDAIGTGHVTPDRLGYLLARNPKLINDVVKKYPDFDYSKAQSYPKVYQDFTSGKVSQQLNAGATAIKHLQDLLDLNTKESHIYGTPDYTSYHNLLDTVVSELGKFYGNDTIPALAGYRKTLGATLPGNREAAIRQQAQSMGKKFDSFEKQWDGAAPSKVYEAPLPFVDEDAQAARARLDPKYADRRVRDARAAAAQAPPPQSSPAAPPNQAPPAAGAGAPLPGTGKVISLVAARALPQFKGMSDAQITQAATKLGYGVSGGTQ